MRILIVDDSRINRFMASDVLEKSGMDIEISVAENGHEALEFIKKNGVDIMILDIIMPELDGLEVLRIMKNTGMLERMKVIMCTSLDDKTALKECFERGASDYIYKPFERTEFIARVKNAVHQLELERELSDNLMKLQIQNMELKELYEKLKATQIQLVQKEQMASVGHLAAGIAHEINNPLGYINSNISIIKEYQHIFGTYIEALEGVYGMCAHQVHSDSRLIQKVNELRAENDFDFIKSDFEELYNDTIDGVKRVRKIVDSLRNFSRIDQLEDHGDYDMNEGLKNMVVLTHSETEHVAEVVTLLDENLPVVQAVGSQINQTLLQMFRNAIDSIKSKKPFEKGCIEILTEVRSGYVVCSIMDNGVGISKKRQQDVFKPFYTNKPIGEGVGLGLSVAYDVVVNKHGGKLTVEGEENGYAKFTIWIPILNKR